MGYTMKTEGMEAVSKMLTDLEGQAGKVAAYGLYDGAGEMADAIRKAADGIRTEEFHYTVFGQRLPSPEEKAAVLSAGTGIAKFDKNGGEVDTSVGYASAGYVQTAYGRTKPVAQLANAINSGTSFMRKDPFFRRGVRSGTHQAEAKIISKIEEQWDETINKNGG